MDQPQTQSQLENNQEVEQQQQVSVLDVDVKDENTALNVLVTFVQIAHKRGAFNIQESAKIWEAVQLFVKRQTPPPVPSMEA